MTHTTRLGLTMICAQKSFYIKYKDNTTSYLYYGEKIDESNIERIADVVDSIFSMGQEQVRNEIKNALNIG